MDPRVVRLPRLDHAADEAQFVLLRVSSAGPRPLDLHLIGTENTAVFAVSCKVATRSASQVYPWPPNSCVNLKTNQALQYSEA